MLIRSDPQTLLNLEHASQDMITLLVLEQGSQKLIDVALNIQKIVQSLLPASLLETTTASGPIPNPNRATSPVDHGLGDYPGERTIWDVEAALILYNMSNGTSLTVQDWMLANSIELRGKADKQVSQESETTGGTKRRAGDAPATSSAEPRKRPRLVSHE